MSLYSDHAQNVNRIRERQAQIEADRIRAKGDFVAGTLSMLGNLPLDILKGKDEQKERERRERVLALQETREGRLADASELELTERRTKAEQSRALNEALQKARTPFDIAEAFRPFDPEKADTLRKKYADEAASLLQGANEQNWGERMPRIMGLTGQGLPAAYPGDDWKKQALQEHLSPKDFLAGSEPELMQGFNPTDPTVPMMVPKKEGARPFVAPTAAQQPPNVGSFEDFLLQKYGPRPTAEQIEQGRRTYNPVDPTLQALRGVTLQNAREQEFSPQVQRRIDQKARAFDSLPIVKKTQTMAEAVSFADGLDPKTTNPADDQALIYAFAKAMDPESVVREGEYATVQKYAQSWAQSFGFNTARIFTNTTFLTPEARANMKRTIKARYQAGKTQYDNVRKEYVSQVNRITGADDGDDWLTDYGAAFPTDAPPPRAPGAAPAPAGVPSYQQYLESQGQR